MDMERVPCTRLHPSTPPAWEFSSAFQDTPHSPKSPHLPPAIREKLIDVPILCTHHNPSTRVSRGAAQLPFTAPSVSLGYWSEGGVAALLEGLGHRLWREQAEPAVPGGCSPGAEQGSAPRRASCPWARGWGDRWAPCCARGSAPLRALCYKPAASARATLPWHAGTAASWARMELDGDGHLLQQGKELHPCCRPQP